MTRSNYMELFGILAIVASILLFMGGLSFLAVILVMLDELSPVFLLPPLVQFALSLLGATAGFFLWRGHTSAIFVLLAVALGVVANCVFIALLFATLFA